MEERQLKRQGRKDLLESAKGINLASYLDDDMSPFQHVLRVFHKDFSISI